MRDRDGLDNNPLVSRQALEALHGQLFGWSLSRCGYDRTAAEDLMQQAYVEILSGRARFDDKSSLKTFMFGVVQILAKTRFRKLKSMLRLADERIATRSTRYRFVAACAVAAITIAQWPQGDGAVEDEFLIAAALLETTQWTAPSDALLPQHQFDIYRDMPVSMGSTESEEGTLL